MHIQVSFNIKFINDGFFSIAICNELFIHAEVIFSL